MTEDYYTALGVHRKASAEEISEAYRTLARKYHPDVNPDAPEARKEFERIQAAFDVLADPERRAAYNLSIRSFATTRKPPNRLDATKWSMTLHPRLRFSISSNDVFLVVVATVAWICVAVLSCVLIALSYADGMSQDAARAYGASGKLLGGGATVAYVAGMFSLAAERFNR